MQKQIDGSHHYLDPESREVMLYNSGCSMDSSNLRNLIKNFLKGCGLVYPRTSSHSVFEADCIAEGARRGYITAENKTFKQFIPAGVAMACNAYHHQTRDIQVFICFYTAFLVYLDDVFENDIEAVRPFNYRFITRQKQNDDLLDHFSELVLEMPQLFGTTEANLMTTSTLNLVTALIIEREFRTVKVCTHDPSNLLPTEFLTYLLLARSILLSISNVQQNNVGCI